MEMRPAYLRGVYLLAAPAGDLLHYRVRNAHTHTFRKFISLLATVDARRQKGRGGARPRPSILGARRPTKPISSPAKNELLTTNNEAPPAKSHVTVSCDFQPPSRSFGPAPPPLRLFTCHESSGTGYEISRRASLFRSATYKMLFPQLLCLENDPSFMGCVCTPRPYKLGIPRSKIP